MEQEHILLPYLERVLGTGLKKSKGNYAFTCPKCNHRKPKLEIQLRGTETGEHPYECWVCGFKGRKLVTLLRNLEVDKELTVRILKAINFQIPNLDSTASKSVQLPEEFIPLTGEPVGVIGKHAKKYLYSRNISDDLIDRYNIGYCAEGEYSDRVIVPSYTETGQLNYFVARSFRSTNLNYLNPDVDKNVIFFENQINWNVPVILVEGVFDAIALRRNTIPILGKNISEKLLYKIVSSSCDKIYVILDQDAYKDTKKSVEKFLKAGKRVYMASLKDKDPGSLNFKDATTLLHQTEEVTYQKFLQLKLNKC